MSDSISNKNNALKEVETIPKRLPLLVIFPAEKIIFPSSEFLPFSCVLGEKLARNKEKIKNSNYFVIFSAPAEFDGKISDGQSVGILGDYKNMKFYRDGTQKTIADFQFRSLFQVYLVETKIIKNNEEFIETGWKIFSPAADPSGDSAKQADFKAKIGMLQNLFSEFVKKLRNFGPAANRDFWNSKFGRKVAQRMRNLNENNVIYVMDDIMTMINSIDFVDEDGGQIRTAVESYAILAETKLEARLDKVLNLLKFLIHGDKSASTTKTESSAQESQAAVKDYQDWYAKIKDCVPKETRNEIERELVRLKKSSSTHEIDKVVEHLNWLLSMPWGVYTKDTENLSDVERVLNKDHEGLEKVKDRILEYLAVRQLNPSAKSPTLCFVGPPGVGKTSLGESIASALGRKFLRFSLGGIRDETDIRGHAVTYIGALPGQIIQLIRRAGSSNPVFMLDEIEKVGKDWRGDPAAALLEVLDPEQNHSFRDHYLNAPFDLSRIFFIATANVLESMHPTLRDRMEIIELPGYSPMQKLDIAKKHLIPKRRKENGFPISSDKDIASSDGAASKLISEYIHHYTEQAGIVISSDIDIAFSDGAISKIINEYTEEAGVRNLERELDKPFRFIAKQVKSEVPVHGKIKVTEKNLQKFCGKSKIFQHGLPEILKPGIMPVLTVSDTGGHVFELEIAIDRGSNENKKITISGALESGEDRESVNKIEESFQVAWKALTSHGRILFDVVQEIEEKNGPIFIHGHITDHAIPKDGPSAGIAILLTLYGILTGQFIKPTKETPLLAATGEITLNLDLIRAVGGIRDKILAAHRYGIRKVIIPEENKDDIEDIPKEVIDEVEIIPLSSMLKALSYVYPGDERIKNALKRGS